MEKLSAYPMTLELLQKTGIGKSVNNFRHHEEFGDLAKMLVKKWKTLALSPAKNGEKSEVFSKVSTKEKFAANGLLKPKKEEKKSSVPAASTFTPESGRFEDILSFGNLVTPKPKKEEKREKIAVSVPKPPPKEKSLPKSFDISELQTDYKPAPPLKFVDDSNNETDLVFPKRKMVDEGLFLKKHSKMQVFSGRKSHGSSEVLSLLDMCLKVLWENLDAIEYTGGIPFEILKPVLLKATAAQLYRIEEFNDVSLPLPRSLLPLEEFCVA